MQVDMTVVDPRNIPRGEKIRETVLNPKPADEPAPPASHVQHLTSNTTMATDLASSFSLLASHNPSHLILKLLTHLQSHHEHTLLPHQITLQIHALADLGHVTPLHSLLTNLPPTTPNPAELTGIALYGVRVHAESTFDSTTTAAERTELWKIANEIAATTPIEEVGSKYR